MRFLIIDDSLADARLLEAMLKQAWTRDFETVHAYSGKEGLEALGQTDFDCVFLDYRLEDSRDWEFLEEIRASGKDIPLIAISAHGNEQVAVEGLKLGAQDYLVKDSLSPETVHRALTNAMEKVKLSRDLAERQREMRDFAHMAAHDLQAPLRRIHQLAEFLQEDLGDQLAGASAQHVQLIGTNAERLQSLVKSLIEFARHGALERPRKVVSLERIREAAVQNLEVDIQETGAQVESASLPDVVGDEVTLTLLFQNLISNAIKFRGPAVPHIQIEAARDAFGWRISIADNGIGVPEKERDAIFTPFRRLHPQREYEGSGIGLATCKRIVDQHGGRIWVESNPGEGSTFYFTFPDAGE